MRAFKQANPRSRTKLSLVLVCCLLLAASGFVITTAGPAAAAPRVVTYPKGVKVASPAQVSRLRGTPPSFRKFVQQRIRHVTSNDCYELGQIAVHRWRSDGWAVASEQYGCGGHSQLYVRTPQGWRAPVALGTQENHACRTLRQWKVPPALLRLPPRNDAPRCYTPSGDRVIYR